jgi:hypothetical protein
MRAGELANAISSPDGAGAAPPIVTPADDVTEKHMQAANVYYLPGKGRATRRKTQK